MGEVPNQCGTTTTTTITTTTTTTTLQPPPHNTGTCILFGDGCGAVLLQAAPTGDTQGCNLLSFSMNSDGAGQKNLHAMYCGQGNKPYSNGQASAPGSYANIAMNGQEVFKFAVRAVPTVIEDALERGGLSKEDIDWLVLHQVCVWGGGWVFWVGGAGIVAGWGWDCWVIRCMYRCISVHLEAMATSICTSPYGTSTSPAPRICTSSHTPTKHVYHPIHPPP